MIIIVEYIFIKDCNFPFKSCYTSTKSSIKIYIMHKICSRHPQRKRERERERERTRVHARAQSKSDNKESINSLSH